MIRLSSEGSTDEDGSPLAWNIFAEIETEDDADELARALFSEQSGDFWTGAARQLFAANLKYLHREMESPTTPTSCVTGNAPHRRRCTRT